MVPGGGACQSGRARAANATIVAAATPSSASAAAGKGITIAHALNVVISDRIVVLPLRGAPVRHVQAAVMAGGETAAVRATLDALREVARDRR